ncbi:hypothetical protein ACISSW_26735 [Escherichia coli]
MKFQAIVLASFLVMPYALADDQGGLKQDAAPPPPHAIEDGYRGPADEKKRPEVSQKQWHMGPRVPLRGIFFSPKIFKKEKKFCSPQISKKNLKFPKIFQTEKKICSVYK